MYKTNLTMSVTGTVDHDGEITVVEKRDDNVSACMTFSFMLYGEQCKFSAHTIGDFKGVYFVKILHHMIEMIGEDEFSRALLMAEIEAKVTEAMGDGK